MFYIYGRPKGQVRFRAIDLEEGRWAEKLIYASMVYVVDEKNKRILDNIAELNNFDCQFREPGGKVVYQTP